MSPPTEISLHRKIGPFLSFVKVSTHIGTARHENQDQAAIINLPDSFGFVLCDGMGGMSNGHWCADIAVSVIQNKLHETMGSRLTLQERIEGAVRAASAAIYKKFAGHGGTTVVLALLTSDLRIASAHVGDSRLYFRQGGRLQRTKDDTVADQLVAMGEPAAEAHRGLLQFVGVDPKHLQVHYRETNATTIELVGTTDGVHEVLDMKPPRGALELVQAALDAKTRDNATAAQFSIFEGSL